MKVKIFIGLSVLALTLFLTVRAIKHRSPVNPTVNPANAQQPIMATPTPVAPEPTPAPAFEENYYNTIVNNNPTNQSILYITDKNNNLWVAERTMASWRLTFAKQQAITYNDERYYNISAIPGATHTLDSQTMTLHLNFPATDFTHSALDFAASKKTQYQPPALGGFFNYDVTANRSTDSNTAQALLEAGIFGRYGVGITTYFATLENGKRSLVRSLSTWTYDLPETMHSIRFGDVISTASKWSGAVNFGGIQYATNFATQPHYLTFPMPGFSGTAIAPSAMDIYVNNALVQHQDVATGPYNISNIPLVDGQGNVRIVTTDILGRQQVVTGNYFISQDLLRVGLHQFAYEAGIIRQNLGLVSNDYSQLLAAATNRFGFTDKTTLEVHAEALSYEQAAGISMTTLVRSLGTVTGSIAVSNQSKTNHKQGALAIVGCQHSENAYSLGISTQIASPYFTQMGIAPGQIAPQMVAQVYGGLAILQGSLGLNYTQQFNRGQPAIRLLSASYSTTLLHSISLAVTLTDNMSTPGSKAGYLSLSHSFDDRTTGNFNSTTQSNEAVSNTFQIMHGLPAGPGYGYALQGGAGSTASKQASLSYQNNTGTYLANYYNSQGQTNYTVNAQGGVALMNGKLAFSRLLNQSFGFVETPDYPGVAVYANNQFIGYTKKDGSLLVPNLPPYDTTIIRIDSTSLPLNTEVPVLEQDVKPYYRSGVRIPFIIKTVRSATMTIIQQNGKPVPDGAALTIVGQTQEQLAGLNGEAYLTGLADKNTLHVLWDTHDCTAEIVLPKLDPNYPIPDLGHVTCLEGDTDAKAAAP